MYPSCLELIWFVNQLLINKNHNSHLEQLNKITWGSSLSFNEINLLIFTLGDEYSFINLIFDMPSLLITY